MLADLNLLELFSNMASSFYYVRSIGRVGQINTHSHGLGGKVEVIRYSLYSLLAICATTIANDQCATATDSLLAICATMNIWLVA